MKRLLIGTVFTFVLLVPTASAVTLVLPDGTERPQPMQRWADASAAPTVHGTVNLRLEPCPDTNWRACVDPVGATIWLIPHTFDRVDLLHELGHIFDEQELSDSERHRFTRAVRAPVGWSDYSHEDGPYATGETFAQAYALCGRYGRELPWLLRGPAGEWGTGYDWSPTVKKHQRICRFIRSTARRPPTPSISVGTGDAAYGSPEPARRP